MIATGRISGTLPAICLCSTEFPINVLLCIGALPIVSGRVCKSGTWYVVRFFFRCYFVTADVLYDELCITTKFR